MCSFLEKVFPIVWARGVTDTRISYTSGQPGVSITARSSAKRQSPEHVTLRRQFFFTIYFLYFIGAAQRIAIAAHAQRAFHRPFFSAVGKVPGDAEYVTLYVHAMESVCP